MQELQLFFIDVSLSNFTEEQPVIILLKNNLQPRSTINMGQK